MPTKTEISDFSRNIEQLALELNCTLMEAILEYCEDTGLEIEVASTLISSALKARIREEAEGNNMLKRTSKLPI